MATAHSLGGSAQLVVPDYIRCGARLAYVTWPRLVSVCLAALLVVVGLSELQEHLPVESDLASDARPVAAAWSAAGAGGPTPASKARAASMAASLRGLLDRAASRLKSGHGAGGKRGAGGKAVWGGLGGPGGGAVGGAGSKGAQPTVVPSWCAPASSLLFLGQKWRLVTLGSPGFPSAYADPAAIAAGPGPHDGSVRDPAVLAREAEAAAKNVDSTGAKLCDWADFSVIQAEFKFKMCTFDRDVDTQISKFIHKDGHWNGGKRDLLEALLPRVNEVMDMPERTMVIDVGANIGFFTLLAATRGYDTIAVEPASASVHRLLHSLHANGVHIAASGDDGGIDTGHTRQPVAYVLNNAASDAYNGGILRFIPDNPGASWIVVDPEVNRGGEAVTTVVLDDLLDAASRSTGAGARRHPGPEAGPAISPGRVRLVKISAEGWDSRALHGMRRLLSVGRVPYVHFVFNADHIRGRGCDARGLILALFEGGYRLWHGSVFIYRAKELDIFLANMAGLLPGGGKGGGSETPARSMELLFVRRGAPFMGSLGGDGEGEDA